MPAIIAPELRTTRLRTEELRHDLPPVFPGFPVPAVLSGRAELEHRIGYPHVMNWFDPTKAHAVPRSVALCDRVCALQGVTGESCVIGG